MKTPLYTASQDGKISVTIYKSPLADADAQANWIAHSLNGISESEIASKVQVAIQRRYDKPLSGCKVEITSRDGAYIYGKAEIQPEKNSNFIGI